MKRPLYKITIDNEYSDGEDLGYDEIAYTADPAIMTVGVALNKTAKPMKFKVDDVKQIIVAPVLIPDLPIYRYDEEEDFEYDVIFEKSVIQQLQEKFMKNQIKKIDVFNDNHTNKRISAFILEVWTVFDSKTDKAFTEFGIEVPSGTVMIMSKVEDRKQYDSLVEEGKIGYSIEGFLGMKLSSLINKKTEIEMKKKIFSKIERKNFTIISEISKWQNDVDNTSFAVGDKVTYTYEGVQYTINDGEYELEDGSKIFVDSDGIIVLVKEAGEKAPESTDTETPAADAELEADKTKLASESETTTEQELADEKTPSEETPATEEIKLALDDATKAEIMELIQPKLDEIIKMIADLEIKMDEEEEEAGETPEELNKSEKMSASQKNAMAFNTLFKNK